MDLNGFIPLLFVLFVSFFKANGLKKKNECRDRSCFPVSGNLLLGREANLTTDSTCGLRGEENYCNLINVNRYDRDVQYYTDQRSECFKCDSRNPNGQHSHRIKNIVSFYKKNKKDRWWQAESEKHKVFIQLDLEAEFHVTHVIMTFRTFRPAAMLIERSYDFGKTWKVYRYFAQKCRRAWPRVPLETEVRRIDEPYCEPLGNPGIPSTGAELVMKVLSPKKPQTNPYTEEVQNLIKITNLRVNFTKLHTLGDNLLGSQKQSYYYALYNMVVSGFCSCYGHADQCIPLHDQNARGMVYGKCECNHHTTGHNCERCLPFYQKQPWRPAHGREKNECQQCDCNNHSTKCHFDPAVYEASRQSSGGVCDDCQDNTMGQNCDQCKPSYYRNPNVPKNHPQTCMQCDCDPRGSEHMGECDSFTDATSGMVAGKCTCKRMVTGARCDTCLPGYFDLDEANPNGCKACSCNSVGTVEGHECESQSGECKCKRFVTGRTCDACMKGYWGLGTDPQGCKQCNCDVGGAIDSQCDSWTGECRCRPHVVGRYCNQVEQGYYYPLLDWLLYEAELARPMGEVELENREIGGAVTWTGSGYMRVHEGASLEFTVNNIPLSMDYELLVRYEAKMRQRWDGIKVKVEKVGGVGRGWGACHNHIPADDHKTFSIDPYNTYVLISPSSCFEKDVKYKIILTFPDYHSENDIFLYVDSFVLLPGTTGHPIFENTEHLEISNLFKRYQCINQFRIPQPTAFSPQSSNSKDCARLVFSSSVAINDGAKPCDCHPTGSERSQCDVRGGKCRCRPHVIGRKCDKCAPLHYGLSNQGCIACNCHPHGSLGVECDQRTGKCPCKNNSFGQKCGNCQRGHWDFPQCRRCECNGRAEECDNDDGACSRCRESSGGKHCERCADGYYGDLRMGCRRCPCPGGHVSHADSCEVTVRTNQVVCRCRHGYAGDRCEICIEGFYGNAMDGRCEVCSCNGNIDPSTPGSCDRRTGECQRCLHNTEGRHCEKCQRGYFGDALRQSCIPCACNILGTRDNQLQTCDPISGTCHCLPNVVGKECDTCQANHWKLASGKGCEPCRCDPIGSHAPQCNQFDGQCQCRPGRGGRDCRECSNLHWGNPNVQCQRCRCNPQGSMSQQCDKRTGACECKKGVSGHLCNRCARGATGSLPNCIPCGPCYDAWENQIQEMNVELEEIVRMSREVEPTGGGHSYHREFHEMEIRLQEIRHLVELSDPSWTGGQDIERLYRTTHELRLNMSNYDRKLGGLEHQARNTSGEIYKLSDRMNKINYRVEELMRLAFELKMNATGIQEKDATGAYDSIKESYNRSQMLQNDVRLLSHNRFRSQQTRTNADRLLDLKKSKIDRMTGNNGQVLKELHYEISNSKRTIVQLNNMVCDGHGAPCDNICGGAGCGHCGRGLTCQEGSVYKASNALDLANQARDVAIAKKNELETINSKVDYRRQQCMTLKQLVERVYREASNLHNDSSSSSSDVGLFIKEVHTFMNEIATFPNQIRELARIVLNYRIEPTERDIENLSRKILTILSSLTNIDHIILSTRDTLEEVNRLQERAENARDLAEKVKGRVDRTTSTLHETTRSHAEVRNSLETLQRRIKEIDGIIGKIGNLSTSGLTDITKLVSYNVAGKINLMKQKIFKNEADVRKVVKTVRETETITNQIIEITRDIESDNRDMVNNVLLKSKEISSYQDKVAVIKNKVEMFGHKMSGWKGFIGEWKEKFIMRRKKFMKWNEDTSMHIINMKALVNDIRRAERYSRNCGTA